MVTLHLLLVLGALISQTAAARESKMGGEDRLYGRLLTGYRKYSRPVTRDRDIVTVTIGVSLREVITLDEDLGHVTILLWQKLIWNDPSLTWDTARYRDVDQLYIPYTNVWTPDITLYNAIHTEPDDVQNHLKLVVNSNGEITWLRPVTYSVTCKHDFRGNAFLCPLTFGSWVYNGDQLDLQPERDDNGKIDIEDDDFLSSDHFVLLGHEGKREVKTYKCCPEHYVSVTYVIKFRNKIGQALFGRK